MDANATGQSGKLERLIELLKQDSSNASLRHRCVEAAAALGQFDVVTDLAREGLAGDPADSLSCFDLATGLIGQGQYREALDVLRSLVERGISDPAIHANMGLCCYCLGAFSDALPHLEFCYQAGEKNSGVVRLLVSAYHHLGRMSEAVAVANDNIEAGGADAALAGVYALLFLDAEDVAKATRWSKVALDLNPKSIDGRVTRATLQTARMQLEEARQSLEGVLSDAPNTGRAWIGLGALSLLARDLPAAKKQISRGLELMPTHIGSWHVLAWTHLLSNDIEAAERAFQTALAGDRNFSESHGGLAVIAAMRGDRAGSQQHIRTALKLDTTCLSAKFAQALLEGNADPARAQAIVRQAIGELASRDGSALSQLLTRVIKH